MSERPREGTQERYIDQWPKPMFLCTHCDEQTDSDPCQECASVFDERGENYPPVLRFQVVPAPAQPEQPRGEEARVADPTPCDRCGNPIGIVWFADNSLFNEITGTVGVGMLCPTCFDHLAAPRLLTWKAAPVGEQELPAPPRGEGDDLAARLEEKARAESDEFGNYHDRYAEGPALPEPPRIESAPARVDPSEVADTRTIEQKLEDWAHDLAHSRVFNGAAPVCREAAALIADLRQTCADQGAAYHALAERLAERSNRDFVACTAAGAEGVRMGVALAEATSGSCTCGRLQLVPEQHKPECPVYRPAQTNGTDEEAADLLREAASLIDQMEKALEAADGLSEAVSKFSILWGMFDPEISRAAYANDFYRSARSTSTKEEQNNGD